MKMSLLNFSPSQVKIAVHTTRNVGKSMLSNANWKRSERIVWCVGWVGCGTDVRKSSVGEEIRSGCQVTVGIWL